VLVSAWHGGRRGRRVVCGADSAPSGGVEGREGVPAALQFPVPKARRGMCVCRAITLRLGISTVMCTGFVCAFRGHWCGGFPVFVFFASGLVPLLVVAE
jgi:hypothetical protein